MIKLSKRLDAIANLIDKEDTVIDIGCDHALMTISLALKNKKKIIKKINVNGYGNKNTKKPINTNSIFNSKKKHINGNLAKIKKSLVKSNILSNKNKNPFKNFPKQPSTEEGHLKSIKCNKKSKTNIYRDVNIDNQKEIKTVKQNSNN